MLPDGPAASIIKAALYTLDIGKTSIATCAAQIAEGMHFWICTNYKLYLHETRKSWTIHLKVHSWYIISFCTWLVIDETWHDAGQIDVCLLPCGKRWAESWGNLGPNEVFWPCAKTRGAIFFLWACNRGEEQKKCVKCCFYFKSYVSNYFCSSSNISLHGAGVQ